MTSLFLRVPLRLSVLFLMLAGVSALAQTTYTVTRFDDTSVGTLESGGGYGPGVSGDLRYEMFAAMAAGGTSTIKFSCSAPPCVITLAAPLPPIFEATANTGATAPASFNLTIDGGTTGNVVIDGANAYRVFWVDNVAVSLNSLVIQNARAKGGDGGAQASGGGGGAGFGAGLFVNQSTASVVVQGTSFVHCVAIGGNGGSAIIDQSPPTAGGGGGGLNYAGGAASDGSSSGGGGGGLAGSGSSGGGAFGGAGGNGGGGGGGGTSGGGGGGLGYAATGGVGAAGTVAGGAGGFGGGGGGGDNVNVGGNGGFGGGGGGVGASAVVYGSGQGGFGGGGGGGFSSNASAAAVGGVHGGSGGTPTAGPPPGGGGAAAGPAIFVRLGTVTLASSNGTGFTATAGAAGGGNAGAGTADATAVFNFGGTVNGATTVGPLAGALAAGVPPTNVGSTSTTTGVATLTFTTAVASGTAFTTNVLTQGATGKDFAFVSGGTCASGTAYAVGATCTVEFSFKPTAAGSRLGAVTLTTATPSVLATTYLSGIGIGPQVTFTPGTISTVASSAGTAIRFPVSVAVDGAGNVYTADQITNAVYKIAGGVVTTFAGNGSTTFSGDGGAATSASLDAPDYLAVDGAGNVYIADSLHERIRKVDAVTGIITTVAGSGQGNAGGDGGAATSAVFTNPVGVAVDGAGNIYVADQQADRVREVSVSTGIISTVAGNGTQGSASAASGASLSSPASVTVDGAGNIYVAETGAGLVRKIVGGTVSTVAGGGSATTDGSLATASALNYPADVAVDGSGNLYVSEENGLRVRKVNASTGVITTVAGTGNYEGTAKDGGPATSADLSNVLGVALDDSGNLYIADSSVRRVRMVTATAANVVFPNTAAGATSTATVTVSNIGTAALTLPPPSTGSNPSVAGPFTLSSGTGCPLVYNASAPGTLAAGADCAETLSYTPTAMGTTSASLTFTDNNLNVAGSTQGVHVAGATATALTLEVIGQTQPIGTTLSLQYILGYTSVAVPTGTTTLTVDHSSAGVGVTACTAKTLHNNCIVRFNTAGLSVGVHEIEVTVTADSTYSAVTATAVLNLTGAVPTASSLSPVAGPISGGTAVSVTGTGFVAGSTSVTIGGNTIPAGSVVVNSATSLTFVTPVHAAGNVTVSVTTATGTSGGVPGGYTYEGAPTTSFLSPSAGPVAGGTFVTVSGTNFVAGNTSVTIGGTVIPVGSVTVNSASSLTFTTPAHAAVNVAVSVATAGGTSGNVPGGFTYQSGVPTFVPPTRVSSGVLRVSQPVTKSVAGVSVAPVQFESVGVVPVAGGVVVPVTGFADADNKNDCKSYTATVKTTAGCAVTQK